MCLTGKKRKELKNQPQQKQNNDNREENRGALCGIVFYIWMNLATDFLCIWHLLVFSS